jgi:hypothetical protein
MPIPAIIGGLGVGLYATSVVKDLLKTLWQEPGLAKKQLSLEEKMMAGQLEGMKMGNEANRLAAQEYMAMLREEKAGQRKDKNEARRMQLIMMMMNGLNQAGQQKAGMDYQQAVGPPPPQSMMALLGGR